MLAHITWWNFPLSSLNLIRATLHNLSLIICKFLQVVHSKIEQKSVALIQFVCEPVKPPSLETEREGDKLEKKLLSPKTPKIFQVQKRKIFSSSGSVDTCFWSVSLLKTFFTYFYEEKKIIAFGLEKLFVNFVHLEQCQDLEFEKFFYESRLENLLLFRTWKIVHFLNVENC